MPGPGAGTALAKDGSSTPEAGKASPAELPTGTGALLQALISDERQIRSLTVYADAQSYLRDARARSAVAAGALRQAIVFWDEAKARERTVVAVVVAVTDKVNLYRQALTELGIAEYTGQSAQQGTDLQAREREVDEVQLGEVAATDTTADLDGAEGALAVARHHLHATRVLVASTYAGTTATKRRFAIAKAQVAVSRRALQDALYWATIPGQAPAQPLKELTRLEGKLALSDGKSTLSAGALVPRGKEVNRHGDRAVVGGGRSTAQPAATLPASTLPASTLPAPAGVNPSTAGAGPLGAVSTTAGPTVPGAGVGPDQSTPAVLAKLGPTVMGPSFLSPSQIEGWFDSTGAVANITIPFTRLVNDYIKAGRRTGVRADISFAQSVVETGYFAFPKGGQDKSSFNNFAGIGACDSCKHGWSFPSPMDGVMTQLELLSEYATPPQLTSFSGGSTASFGIEGCCTTWMALSGVWASNPAYGYEILSVYREMLDWALQAQLQKVGLQEPVMTVAGPEVNPVDPATTLPNPATTPAGPATTLPNPATTPADPATTLPNP